MLSQRQLCARTGSDICAENDIYAEAAIYSGNDIYVEATIYTQRHMRAHKTAEAVICMQRQ